MSQPDFPDDIELPEEVDETTGLRRRSTRRRSTYSGTRRRAAGKVTLARCLQDLFAYFFNIKLPQRFFTLLKGLFCGSRRK